MASERSDKRKSARVPVDIQAQFHVGSVRHSGRILNLSLDGLFLQTERLFDSNEELHLDFQLANESVELIGRVIWGGSMEGLEKRAYGLGIRFETVAAPVRQQIDNYIRTLLKA